MPPRVSVLLPVRNAAPFLPDALDSLRDQTLEDFEVVAVDDGSTDGSLDLLDTVARQDDRFVVLKQEASGIVPALERARFAARGPYLARMDADDIAPLDRLQRQLDRMEADPSLALCGIGVRYFPRDLLKEGRVRYEAWLNSLASHDEIVRDIFVECPLAHPTFLMKAPWVASAGGYQEGPWPEDYDLVLRLWEKGARFARVEGEPLLWRDHPREAVPPRPKLLARRLSSAEGRGLGAALPPGGPKGGDLGCWAHREGLLEGAGQTGHHPGGLRRGGSWKDRPDHTRGPGDRASGPG